MYANRSTIQTSDTKFSCIVNRAPSRPNSSLDVCINWWLHAALVL